jgi:hypothetical protein
MLDTPVTLRHVLLVLGALVGYILWQDHQLLWRVEAFLGHTFR